MAAATFKSTSMKDGFEKVGHNQLDIVEETDDYIGEDAAEVLEEILPFIEMVAATFKRTSMKDSFEKVGHSQLIHRVIDNSHLFGGVMGCMDMDVYVRILGTMRAW
ncbi:hypothetical protein GOP47_0018962 [Adiantum capillus-veneris]|uniref:Uncharacterized protein n=1 Tax=Adiantum capillus-veneris TaxID=13818 RepID=A0A9D4Z8M8_ADICA|nr:hypothetical protein GOP47_0018962 [Adiantum capillus-veneris]